MKVSKLFFTATAGRIIFLAILFSFVSMFANAQAQKEKITPEEYIEANEFARMFWGRFLETKDIKPLLEDYAASGFDRDICDKSFAFIKEGQIRPSRISSTKRYYFAETNFLLLFLMWTNSISTGYSEDPLKSLPNEVRRVITKRVMKSIDNNDSNYSETQSDDEANKYFDMVLSAFERANPILRKYVIKIGGGKNVLFRKNMKEIEEYNDYAFRPEVTIDPYGCSSERSRVLFMDVPFFQLALTKVDGRLRVAAFVFHID